MNYGEEKVKNHISILGSCCKDIFGFHSNNGGYIIDKSIQSCGPLSLIMKSPLLKKADENFAGLLSDKSDIYKRVIRQDAEKSVFSYIREVQSDWLMIDFAEMRYPIYLTESGAGTAVFPEKIRTLREHGYIGEYQLLNPRDLSEERLYKGIDLFLNRILKLYPEEKIILVDIRAAEEFVNTQSKRCDYYQQEQIDSVNPIAEKCYQYALSHMPSCHTIPFPEETVGKAGSQWGTHCLHYSEEYYDYGLKAMNIISGGSFSLEEERCLIEKLKEMCNEKVRHTYRNYPKNKVRFLYSEVSTYKRFKRYEEYFKKMARQNKGTAILDFFAARDIKTCSFYGLNEISKYYMDVLDDSDIKCEYIVENNNLDVFQGAQIIERNASVYPVTDCMVIADLDSEKVRRKLQTMGYNGLIVDYNELIASEDKE